MTSPKDQSLITLLQEKVASLTIEIENAEKNLAKKNDELADHKRALGWLTSHAAPGSGNVPGEPQKTVNTGEMFERWARDRAGRPFTFADILTMYRERNVKVSKNYQYYLVNERYVDSLEQIGEGRARKFNWTRTTSE